MQFGLLPESSIRHCRNCSIYGKTEALELSNMRMSPKLPEVFDMSCDNSFRIGDTAGGKDGQQPTKVISKSRDMQL